MHSWLLPFLKDATPSIENSLSWEVSSVSACQKVLYPFWNPKLLPIGWMQTTYV
jgi:hypothetical protein